MPRSRHTSPALLLLLALPLLAACGAERVTYEQRIELTLAHRPPGTYPVASATPIRVDVSGNLRLEGGALTLWYVAAGDSAWVRLPMVASQEAGRWEGLVPQERSGTRVAYFFEADTPSGERVTLPEGSGEQGGAPFTAVRAGRSPWLLTLLMRGCVLVGVLFLLGAGAGAWFSLQKRQEPGSFDQARIARWVGIGTLFLIAGAGVLGVVHAIFLWGVPYRGFPVGPVSAHTKALEVLILWGVLSWSAWGSLTRRPGARDLLPPRAYAILVLVGLGITLLLVLLPSGGGGPGLPAVSPAG